MDIIFVSSEQTRILIELVIDGMKPVLSFRLAFKKNRRR
jgi:hypothetical protein